MQKRFQFVLFVLVFLWGCARTSVVSAEVCVNADGSSNPIYCMGPCGIVSNTCSCTSQSCVTVTPNPPNCKWSSDADPCDKIKDGYGNIIGCKSCLYCTTTNDTFTCPGAYNPCYTGDCAPTSTPVPTGEPIPTPIPGVGWCTVMANVGSVATGQPVTVTLQASSQNAVGNTAHIRVVRRDKEAIAGLPAEANNIYSIASCSSTTNICSTSTTRTLPTGEYFFFCGYAPGAPACTGNPFCAHESVIPAVTEVACPGCSSCKSSLSSQLKWALRRASADNEQQNWTSCNQGLL